MKRVLLSHVQKEKKETKRREYVKREGEKNKKREREKPWERERWRIFKSVITVEEGIVSHVQKEIKQERESYIVATKRGSEWQTHDVFSIKKMYHMKIMK